VDAVGREEGVGAAEEGEGEGEAERGEKKLGEEGEEEGGEGEGEGSGVECSSLVLSQLVSSGACKLPTHPFLIWLMM
jgi:hypothetical protein